MKPFRTRGGELVARLDPAEAGIVGLLLDQLERLLVETGDVRDDPVVARLFPREPTTVFFDNMDGDDLGWTFEYEDEKGGPLFGLPPDDEGTNEWERGVPEQSTIAMEGTYSCNGAPCNLGQQLGSPIPMFEAIAGFNQAFSGTQVWDTDLDGVYAPDSVHRLVSPQIDLPFLPMVFEISMGVRSEEREFRDRLDEILVRLRPEIERVLDEYAVPRVGPAGPGMT